MEKPAKAVQTDINTNTSPMNKLQKYVDMLERDIRRTGKLLHSEAIWELASSENCSKTTGLLKDASKHMTELVDWVDIHKSTLTKDKTESQTETA